MPNPATNRSFPDDPDAVAELGDLDGFERDVRAFIASTPKGKGWSLKVAEPPEALADLYRFDEAGASVGGQAFSGGDVGDVEDEPRPARAHRATRRRLPVLMLVLFVCLGASSAAAVFHDRVVQIVAHWKFLP